jgi:hypothetical protein
LAAISLATVLVTPMTFVKFNFKFANPTKSYEVYKTRISRSHLLYGETRGKSKAARRLKDESFPEGVLPSRCTLVELYLRLCEAGSDWFQ